jgi:chromosome segregation ATPase
LEKEISDIDNKLASLKEKDIEYEKQIRNLETEIDRFQNVHAKLEEIIEKIDILQMKAKNVEEKNLFLEYKLEMFEKANKSYLENFTCSICDLIFKPECDMNEHTGEVHTNKENTILNDNAADEKVFQCDECTYKYPLQKMK